jgi:hypothetical protein
MLKRMRRVLRLQDRKFNHKRRTADAVGLMVDVVGD